MCLSERGWGKGCLGREWDQFKQAQVPCAWFRLVTNVSFDAGLIKHVSELGGVGLERGISIFLSTWPLGDCIQLQMDLKVQRLPSHPTLALETSKGISQIYSCF
jgi:hypothetical protein